MTRVTRCATLVRANNPSPMTLDGTNTWVLAAPGASSSIVVDPGPDDAAHFEAIRRVAGDVRLIVLTHGHSDHAAGCAAFASLTGAPVRAADPALCVNGKPLQDAEKLDVDGLRVDVVATPGHSADSACFVLSDDNTLLTGDTLLGRGSTVIVHPEGRLGDYLASLRKLRSLVDEREIAVVLPGHGPVRHDPADLIDGYLAHRERRLDDVRAALADGVADVDALLRRVYPDVDETLLRPARWSLLAQLEYLREPPSLP